VLSFCEFRGRMAVAAAIPGEEEQETDFHAEWHDMTARV
jgi:hypothetical protein